MTVNAMHLVISLLFGYALGSLNTSVIISKEVFKRDVREHGSKNAGMSNTLRVFGAKAAVIVTVCDLLKTALSVFLCSLAFGKIGLIAAGSGTVLGHVFPVYYGFKGGKGVLCSLIVVCAINWRIAAVALAVWGLVFLIGRIMSLSSVVAAVSTPFLTHLFQPDQAYIIFVSLLCALVITLHHTNIARILNGTEKKIAVGKSRVK